MNRIFIRSKRMPITIRAFTVPDSNGDYNVYINEDLSDEAKNKSLSHEIKHIKRGDFYKSVSARVIESEM